METAHKLLSLLTHFSESSWSGKFRPLLTLDMLLASLSPQMLLAVEDKQLL